MPWHTGSNHYVNKWSKYDAIIVHLAIIKQTLICKQSCLHKEQFSQIVLLIQIAYHGMTLHTKTASECKLKLNIIRLCKPEFSLLAKCIWVHNIKARGWITRLKCSLDIYRSTHHCQCSVDVKVETRFIYVASSLTSFCSVQSSAEGAGRTMGYEKTLL